MNQVERRAMLWELEARIEAYSDAEVRIVNRAINRANRSLANRNGLRESVCADLAARRHAATEAL